MKKKTKYSSRLLDFFVTAVLICIALTFSWFFYQDLNRSGMRTDKTPVATIKFKNRIAQRKYIDRVVWERLSKTSPVYDGDIIRTEDLAQAVIEFDDHSSLELNENTMLQIYYSPEKGLRIAVDGGQIALEAGENSNVTLTLDDGSVVNVDSGASVAAKSTPAGARNLEVKSGTAQIQTEAGTVQALESGQSVSVQKNGEIVKNPVTVTSIPNDLKILSTESGEVPVKLEWNKDSSAGTVRLQTSKTKNFSVIEEEKVVTGTSEEIHVPDGKIYWRIFTDDDVESAATGKISVEAVVKARNISPASSAEFRYRNARPSVNFMWQGSDSADYYSVVVSSTPDMNSVVFQKETEATSLRTDSLEEGTYWWKVMPYYSLNSTGFAGESEITSFTVVKNEQIAPPQLFVPSDNAEITWKTKPSVSFSWKSEIKDASYTLLVSRSGNFDSPDAEYEVSDTRLAVDLDSSQFPDSSYYWKVIRHSSDEDDIHKESDVRSFKIAKYVPQDNKLLYPPQNFNTEKAKLVSLEFMWKLSDDYKDALSVIQFSDSADFKDIALERETDRQGMAGISLKEGSWWWRVGAKAEDG
ncbi:MAG: hypothetical protein J6Y93_03020, partial [Treponema sp.]|nr:hypothetical protein [Treponema sp.]